MPGIAMDQQKALSYAVKGNDVEFLPLYAKSKWNIEKYSMDNYFTRFTTVEINKRYENCPALIAHDHYSDYKYWWIICMFNGIQDPTTDLYVGRRIKVPDRAQIDAWLAIVPNTRIGPDGNLLADETGGRIVRV